MKKHIESHIVFAEKHDVYFDKMSLGRLSSRANILSLIIDLNGTKYN